MIETDRLRLRPWIEADLESYARICADPEVMRYIGRGVTYSRARSEQSLAAIVKHLDEHGFGLWAAVDKTTDTWIGLIGLAFAGPGYDGVAENEVEIGWRFDRAYWGRGLATEGARACRDYAFEQLGLDGIVSIYQPGNTASRRVMEKLGMSYLRDGRGKRAEDVRIYGLDRATWASAAPALNPAGR